MINPRPMTVQRRFSRYNQYTSPPVMVTVTSGSSHWLISDAESNNPKLTPQFQPITKLKNGVTSIMRGGCMTVKTIHNFVI